MLELHAVLPLLWCGTDTLSILSLFPVRCPTNDVRATVDGISAFQVGQAEKFSGAGVQNHPDFTTISTLDGFLET